MEIEDKDDDFGFIEGSNEIILSVRNYIIEKNLDECPYKLHAALLCILMDLMMSPEFDKEDFDMTIETVIEQKVMKDPCTSIH